MMMMSKTRMLALFGVSLLLLSSLADAKKPTMCIQCKDCGNKLPEATECPGDVTVEGMCQTVVIHEHTKYDIVDRMCPSIPIERKDRYESIKKKEGFQESVYYCFGDGCNTGSPANQVCRGNAVLVVLAASLASTVAYLFKHQQH